MRNREAQMILAEMGFPTAHFTKFFMPEQPILVLDNEPPAPDSWRYSSYVIDPYTGIVEYFRAAYHWPTRSLTIWGMDVCEGWVFE